MAVCHLNNDCIAELDNTINEIHFAEVVLRIESKMNDTLRKQFKGRQNKEGDEN